MARRRSSNGLIKLDEAKSYDDVVAWGKRIMEHPQWRIMGQLMEKAQTFTYQRQTISITDYHADVKPKCTLSTFQRWLKSYYFWKKLPIKVRQGFNQEWYYQAARNHPKYKDGRWTAVQAFQHVTKTGAGGWNLKHYMSAMGAAVNLIKRSPELLNELDDITLQNARNNVAELVGLLGTPRRRKATRKATRRRRVA
jgi:hypothetical protein